MCKGHAEYPAFALSSSEVAVGVLVFLYHLSCHLPCVYSSYFFVFYCWSRCKQRIPGPRLSQKEGLWRGEGTGNLKEGLRAPLLRVSCKGLVCVGRGSQAGGCSGRAGMGPRRGFLRFLTPRPLLTRCGFWRGAQGPMAGRGE